VGCWVDLGMKRLLQIIVYLIILLIENIDAKIIYDFNHGKNINDWFVVDDVVMGGESLGSFSLDKDGNGLYSGYVSLENYGGFSSVRCKQKEVEIDKYKYIVIKVFGDNKFYQLRIRSKNYDRHVFVKNIYVKNEWEEIKIPLNSMEPQFRGRKLKMRNFNSDSIVELGILIGNKVEENFSLKIDYIAFE
jgi:NADH dehydrogenase [ubiquinone] 1 alpha subcomplex assembly factor 1